MKSASLHKRACKLLGINPAKIRLIGPAEVKRLTGHGVSRNWGEAFTKHNAVYVRRSAGYDTHVHELLHILFPSRTHRWIFAASWKLSGMRDHAEVYGYGLGYQARNSDAPESRAKLLRLAHQSATRRELPCPQQA